MQKKDIETLKSVVAQAETDTAELWQSIIPGMPDYVPMAPGYDPVNPTKILPNRNNLGAVALSRRTYLDMRRMVQTYSQLLLLAPATDQNIIVSLRSQMELLSISMLNIYQTLSGTQDVPLQTAWFIPLPKDYSLGLQVTYNRLFSVYLQTLNLFNQTAEIGSATSSTLIIIINNLKSQLSTVQGLINAQTVV